MIYKTISEFGAEGSCSKKLLAIHTPTLTIVPENNS